MRIISLICFAAISIFLPSLICEAQIITYPVRVIPPLNTLFWHTKSQFNPAATGIEKTYQASLTGRSQWIGYKNAPFNLGLSLAMKSEALHGGVGIDYIYSKFGQIQNNHEFKANYAYQVKLGNDQILSVGVSGEMTLMRYDNSFPDPLLSDSGHKTFYDFQFGLFYLSDHLQLGLSSNHFQYTGTNSDKDFLSHIYLYSSYDFNITGNIEFRPEVLILLPEFETDAISLNTGIIVTVNKILWTGFTYRTNNSYGGTVGVNIAGKIKLGYLFEYTGMPDGDIIGNQEFMASFSM